MLQALNEQVNSFGVALLLSDFSIQLCNLFVQHRPFRNQLIVAGIIGVLILCYGSVSRDFLLEKDIHIFVLSNQDHPFRLQLGYVSNLALHLSEIGNDFPPSQGQLCQYPFKGLFYLVSLELKEFQQVYPDDFMNLTELESLSISKAEINDLLWLERAQYQLKYLFIDANIIDCSGIESQNHLETLILSHTSFHDADPIDHLTRLEMLDLRWNEIQDEGALCDKGIPHVLITREDGARYMIETQVHGIIGHAVRYVLSWEKNVDTAPPILRRNIQKNLKKPFLDRVQDAIVMEYESELNRFTEPGFAKHSWLTDDEYLATFKQKALEFFPFLSDSRDPGEGV